MAEVTAWHRWADGSVVGLTVQADAETIECVDILRPIVVAGLRDAIVNACVAVNLDDEAEDRDE